MSDQRIHIAIVRSEPYLIQDYMYDLDVILSKKLEKSEKFKNISFEVVAWDLPNDWDKFTHILLGGGIDYVEHPEKFLSWLDGLPPSISKKVLNSPSIIRWNMNKSYLSEMKEKSKIPIPPTVLINKNSPISGKDIIEKLKNQTNKIITDLVLKNQIDAGAYSTKKIQLKNPDSISEKELKIIKTMMGETEYGLIIQKFVPGIQTEGEWSVIYFDRKISHCNLKKSKENDFRVQWRHGGIHEMADIEKVPRTVLELSKKVIDSVPETENLFYARVDIVRDEEETFLMELEAFEPDLYLRDGQIIENFLNAICSPKYKF